MVKGRFAARSTAFLGLDDGSGKVVEHSRFSTPSFSHAAAEPSKVVHNQPIINPACVDNSALKAARRAEQRQAAGPASSWLARSLGPTHFWTGSRIRLPHFEHKHLETWNLQLVRNCGHS
jgi:hypothetical protein